MTIIKQTAVTDKSHQQNLRQYINDDKKVLLRGSQNLDDCIDVKRWATFMEATRHKYGHDKATRKIRDKKTGELVDAKNTIMYHQILAFLPDECDINGGKLTPKDCMSYAQEYAKTYYPNQQVVFALHNEYCNADRTHRYAVHMVINRTDTVTGKRLDEGRSRDAKVRRAKRVREMDDRWGLKQVERDERNSAVHKRQPSKVEREIEARGGESYKTNTRELCRIAFEKAENIYDFREMLEGWGIETEFRNGKMYATDTDNSRYSFSVKRLDSDFDQKGLEKAFLANMTASIRAKGERVIAEREAAARERERVQGVREAYLSRIREAYLGYRKKAHAMMGTDLKEFPKFRVEKPPEEIANDPEVKRTILAYWRGADELRTEMAANVPYARGSKTPTHDTSETNGQRPQERESGERGWENVNR